MAGGAAVRAGNDGTDRTKILLRAVWVGAVLFLLCVMQTTVLRL